MRLIHSDTSEFSLTKEFLGDDTIPPYAILSHTWRESHEVTFRDLIDGTGKSKAGYKIQFCGQQAERDGLQHYTVPPPVTMPYEKGGICRRKQRKSSPGFKY
ncbi:hypothetical protein GQ44DRAFT_710251 [Phaeosphaeriaceae sp. PMI808]|nr:hypothetical protein GQ44DRAFT_710251 [Phaeosphaeriaceae sp. PMI808]